MNPELGLKGRDQVETDTETIEAVLRIQNLAGYFLNKPALTQ